MGHWRGPPARRPAGPPREVPPREVPDVSEDVPLDGPLRLISRRGGRLPAGLLLFRLPPSPAEDVPKGRCQTFRRGGCLASRHRRFLRGQLTKRIQAALPEDALPEDVPGVSEDAGVSSAAVVHGNHPPSSTAR
jgi:hypothetical protein